MRLGGIEYLRSGKLHLAKHGTSLSRLGNIR